MDTCEYCEADITIAAEVVLGPDGPEHRGCCERCGHVVSVGVAPTVARAGGTPRGLPLAS